MGGLLPKGPNPGTSEGRVTRVPDFHYESALIGDSQGSSLRADLSNTPTGVSPKTRRPPAGVSP